MVLGGDVSGVKFGLSYTGANPVFGMTLDCHPSPCFCHRYSASVDLTYIVGRRGVAQAFGSDAPPLAMRLIKTLLGTSPQSGRAVNGH